MRTILTVATLSVLALASSALACPTCKGAVEVLPPSEGSSGLPGGFNLSVYLLLGAVLAAMGVLLRVIVKASKSTGANAGTMDNARV